MPLMIMLHVSGEDPIIGEMDQLPTAGDSVVIVNNPRRRDGKDLSYVHPNVVTVAFPLHRVNFLEVMPAAEEEKLIGFVRE